MNTVINSGPEVFFVNAGRNVQQMTQPAQQPPPCSSAVVSVACPCVPFKESCLVELALMVERRVFFLRALSSTAGGGAFRIQRWTTVLIAGDGVVQEGKDSPDKENDCDQHTSKLGHGWTRWEAWCITWQWQCALNPTRSG